MKKRNHNSVMYALPILLSLAIVGCGGGGDGDDSPTSTNDSSGGSEPHESTGEEHETPNTEGETNNGSDTDSNSGSGDSQDVTSPDDEPPTDEDNDEESTSDAHPILSNVWAGATCSEYDTDIYFKSLYQFGGNGELLLGLQIYQDAACTIPGAGYKKPQSNNFYNPTYSLGELETLADGTSGYPVHLESTIEVPAEPEPPEAPEPLAADAMDENCDPGVADNTCATAADGDSVDDDSDDADDPEVSTTSADAYLGLKDAQTLCFSSNILIDTELLIFNMDGDASVMDYENCLTLFSAVDELSDTSEPLPEPGPDTEITDLTEVPWLADNICYPGDNDEESFQRIFEFIGGLILNSDFLTYNTTDCTGESHLTYTNWTENQGQYTDHGEETLADGVVGHRIEITNLVLNQSEMAGFYVVNELGHLCASYNLGMNSDTNASSTDIDYEHCLKPFDWEKWEEWE